MNISKKRITTNFNCAHSVFAFSIKFSQLYYHDWMIGQIKRNKVIKPHEIIIFYKKNIIWYFCLFNPKTFLIFAQKVQYNTLLDMKIQEVMKLQRKALGITQQDLADMSEIAISTIKKIESGKGNPSLSTVEKIMDILGMEVKYEIRQTV